MHIVISLNPCVERLRKITTPCSSQNLKMILNKPGKQSKLLMILNKPGKQSKLFSVISLLTQLYLSLLLMVSKSLTASQLLSNLINTLLGFAQDLANKIMPSNLPSSIPSSIPPNLDSFALTPTSPFEIIAISRTLKQTHSTGLDDIKSTLISPVIELI